MASLLTLKRFAFEIVQQVALLIMWTTGRARRVNSHAFSVTAFWVAVGAYDARNYDMRMWWYQLRVFFEVSLVVLMLSSLASRLFIVSGACPISHVKDIQGAQRRPTLGGSSRGEGWLVLLRPHFGLSASRAGSLTPQLFCLLQLPIHITLMIYSVDNSSALMTTYRILTSLSMTNQKVLTQ
jgi:hypothetical protein